MKLTCGTKYHAWPFREDFYARTTWEDGKTLPPATAAPTRFRFGAAHFHGRLSTIKKIGDNAALGVMREAIPTAQERLVCMGLGH